VIALGDDKISLAEAGEPVAGGGEPAPASNFTTGGPGGPVAASSGAALSDVSFEVVVADGTWTSGAPAALLAATIYALFSRPILTLGLVQ
jgi:hypothetical protein